MLLLRASEGRNLRRILDNLAAVTQLCIYNGPLNPTNPTLAHALVISDGNSSNLSFLPALETLYISKVDQVLVESFLARCARDGRAVKRIHLKGKIPSKVSAHNGGWETQDEIEDDELLSMWAMFRV